MDPVPPTPDSWSTTVSFAGRFDGRPSWPWQRGRDGAPFPPSRRSYPWGWGSPSGGMGPANRLVSPTCWTAHAGHTSWPLHRHPVPGRNGGGRSTAPNAVQPGCPASDSDEVQPGCPASDSDEVVPVVLAGHVQSPDPACQHRRIWLPPSPLSVQPPERSGVVVLGSHRGRTVDGHAAFARRPGTRRCDIAAPVHARPIAAVVTSETRGSCWAAATTHPARSVVLAIRGRSHCQRPAQPVDCGAIRVAAS